MIKISRIKEKIKIKELVIGIVFALFLVTVLQKFFIIANIPTESMTPTLGVNDKVFIKTNVPIQRGRIYAFTKNGTFMIKRCIGVSGDHIQVNDNDVFVNGEKLEENYVASSDTNDINTSSINIDITVPDGEIFMLGDNRAVSYDSRYWEDKFVSNNDVFGEVQASIIPYRNINKEEVQ